MREDRFCFLILLHIRIWKLISSWPSASHIAAYAYGLMSIVFSSGSGFSLSGWGFGAARAEIVPVWLSRLWCCNSNRSNFQRRFYSDGSGRGEKAAASTAPPLFFFFVVMRWGAGWVGLELELHNGCLSELIKRKKKKKEKTFHPLVLLGKQGHKWGRMPSVHVFSEPGHRDRDEVWDWDFTFELSVLFIWHTYCVTTEAVCHHQMAFCMSFHAI